MEEIKYKCPNCGGEHTTKWTKVVNKSGIKLRRKCQECGQTFYPEDKGNN